MAQFDLGTIEKIEKIRNTIHTPAKATYSSFDIDGQHYFQLDMYGTDGRATEAKVAQSLQLDEKSARFLVKLLIDEFHML